MGRIPSRRRALTLLCLAVVMVAMVGCGLRSGGVARGEGQAANNSLRFAHVVTPETPKGMAAEKFKELVEERSDERIFVEIYPNSELYGDEDELQALQSGAVQMLAPASAKFTTIAPEVQVLDLPFLFDSVEEIPEVAARDTNVGRAIFRNEALRERNIRVLGLWDNGLKQLSSNRRMKRPEDLSGLEFRIQPSDVLRSQFQAWDAQATPLAFAEVYNALQQGVLDGQENPYSNIESQNMQTVQSHITESNHGYVGYVLVINEDYYQSLPDDLKKVIVDSARDASIYNREISKQVNDEALQTIEEGGTTEITVLTDEERNTFKDAVVPSIWNNYRGVIGDDIIDELLARERRQEG